MKCILFIVCCFFFVLQAQGQTIDDVENVLKSRRFDRFKMVVDSSCRRLSWVTLREITPGYSEGVVEMEDDQRYQINILLHEGYIFYYSVTIYKSCDPVTREWSHLTRCLSIDSAMMFDFQLAFVHQYRIWLDEKDLFNETMYSPGGCGDAPFRPYLPSALKSMTYRREIDSIGLWLRSANVEKQLYAYTALKILEYEGIGISIPDRYVIDIIRNKKGVKLGCAGCFQFTKDSIKNTIAWIESRDDWSDFSQPNIPTSRKYIQWCFVIIILIAVVAVVRSNRQIAKRGSRR